MRINSVELSGWMPFRKHFSLELPAGPIAVIGMHSGDDRRSNRAGKTSFLEAVTWCLYGVHRKRVDDDIINRTCDEVRVVVTLGDVRVKRVKKRGSSTKLFVMNAGVETTGATAQHEIQQVIGLSLRDYLATACFRQGDVEAIIKHTASDRLVVVSEWLQQGMWFEAKRVQSSKASAADKALASARGAATAAKAAIQTEAMVRALIGDRDRAKQQCDELDAEMNAVAEQMQGAIERHNQVAKSRELETLRVEGLELRQKIVGRAKCAGDVEVNERKYREVRAASDRASVEYRKLRAVVQAGFDGQCPVMCQACPVASDVTAEVRAADALMLERRNAVDQTGKALVDADVVWLQSKLQLAEFDRNTNRYQSVVARGKQLASEITIDVSPEAIAKMPTVESVRASHAVLRERVAKLQNRIGEIDGILQSSAEAEQRFKSAEKQVADAEVSSQVSRLALRAIQSVPSRIASQQLGELEQEVNLLLAGSGVSLRFSWARELDDKAAMCDECGHIYASKRGDDCPACKAPRQKKLSQELEFLCDDGSGIEEDVRFNSGGTQAVVGSALRLAASAMLRRMRSSRIAWAVADEPFAALDVENREALARTFAGMLSSVGLEQALVVSHDQALLRALPHRLVVEKDGANSSIRLE